jgi:hypothetical protein
MVETGSAGASSNTPASSFDFDHGVLLALRRGVHRIRTITSVPSATTDRPNRVDVVQACPPGRVKTEWRLLHTSYGVKSVRCSHRTMDDL